MKFSIAETEACGRLIALALAEDLGSTDGQCNDVAGDLTSATVIPSDLHGQAAFVARSPGVLAGLPAVEMLLTTGHMHSLEFEPIAMDGSGLAGGDVIALVRGKVAVLLGLERIALNILQHLSGIATLTRKYVDAVAGLPCRILDTRKTIPGWRLLEKYAVRCGGGSNQRFGLHDGILVKDNHLAALGGGKLAFAQLQQAIRTKFPGRHVSLEIEVESLDQLEMAFACEPDIILLDNMDLKCLRSAVNRRNERARQIALEASGGILLEKVRAIAETGVDRISVGALTHSAPALDIALDYKLS